MDYKIFITSAQMLMHAVAHEGCTDTDRESALKVDYRRQIPSRNGDSKLSQQRAGLTLYPLGYISTQRLHAHGIWDRF